MDLQFNEAVSRLSLKLRGRKAIHSESLELKRKLIWFHKSWSLYVIAQFKQGLSENLKAMNSEKEGTSLTDWKRQKIKPQS